MTAGAIQKAGTSTALADSALSEDSTTISASKPILATYFQTTGSDPYSAEGNEASATAASAGKGKWGFNSATHRPYYSYNGGTPADALLAGDALDATKLGGLVPAASLPTPTPSAVGGIKSMACSSLGANYHIQKLNTDGSVTCAIDAGGSAGGGSGGPAYGVAFTAQTSVTVTGVTHGLATKNLIVACYDNASPAKAIQPASYTVDGSTYDVVIAFASAQTGYCVVNGSVAKKYSASFGSTASLSVTAATHGLGAGFIARIYDSSGNAVEPGSMNVDGSGNLTVTFGVAMAGKVVITQ